MFQLMSPGREAAKALVSLKQGKQSVTDYTVELRTIAADSGWNQPLIKLKLIKFLKDHMAPLDLEAVINLASKMDKRLSECHKSRFQQDHFGLVPFPSNHFFLQTCKFWRSEKKFCVHHP